MHSDSRVIDALQALRGAAALAVFLFHLVPYFAVSGTNLFPAWLWRSGEFGVDLFFVLSGVVLTLGYASRDLSVKGVGRFYLRRGLRIYSGYWPFLLAMLLVNTSFGFERALDDNLLGSVLLTEIGISKLVLGVSWSLSFELYFYALFGLLFLVPQRLALVLLGLYAAAIVYLQYFLTDAPLADHFVFSPFILEFLLGCVVGALYQRQALTLRSSSALALTALCFVIGAVLTQSDPDRIPHLSRLHLRLGQRVADHRLLASVCAVDFARRQSANKPRRCLLHPLFMPHHFHRRGSRAGAVYLAESLSCCRSGIG